MERKIVESREPRARGAAREQQTDLEVCRLGLLTCLVLEVMVLHKIVILRGTRGCAHKSFPRVSLGKQGWPYLPTPWESSAFDSL